jgi:hypothetical protein
LVDPIQETSYSAVGATVFYHYALQILLAMNKNKDQFQDQTQGSKTALMHKSLRKIAIKSLKIQNCLSQNQA